MKQYVVGAGVLLLLILTIDWWMPVVQLNVCRCAAMIGKLALVVTLVVTVADGCSDRGSTGERPPPINQGPANVRCSVSAEHPHWSSGNPNFIVGKVRVKCSGANIDSLAVEVKLQRREDGEWFDVPSAMLETAPIAPANDGQTYTRQANFPCAKAHKGDVFRTAGRASGMFGGRPAGSATWTYAPVTGKEVQCQK